MMIGAGPFRVRLGPEYGSASPDGGPSPGCVVGGGTSSGRTVRWQDVDERALLIGVPDWLSNLTERHLTLFVDC